MHSNLRQRIGWARDAIETRALDVWRRDRASLRGWSAFKLRLLRIAIASVRGVSVHQLGFQAAALTYYTVFSLVPLLVVVVWILKIFDRSPAARPAMPLVREVINENAALHSLLGRLLENVSHTSQVTGGIASLVALLYAVVRLFRCTERALDRIASSTTRKPKLSRLFSYLALLVLPPLLGVVVGPLAGAAHDALASEVSRLFGSAVWLKVGLTALLGFSALWLAIAILYAAAARARIAFSSAAVGAAAAAILLVSVLWVFARFQIGMSRGNSVQFGATAGPVFLLWAFSSWFVVLLGAEIAVGHSVDRVLIHGAWCLRLDALGEQETGVEIMVRAARGHVSVDGLARELRLGPTIIRRIGMRLVERGLLAAAGLDQFALGCDADRIGVAEIMDAVVRDPALDAARRAWMNEHRSARLIESTAPREVSEPGPTLRELAGQPATDSPATADVVSSLH
jgi:YihY family inner membrane protein